MTPELISVLMPVLNEEVTVADAVQSVLDQLDVAVEVLVIDGRSTDNTVAVVSALAETRPQIRLMYNDKTKIAAGLNVGLRQSRGRLVARVDGHSTVSRDYLRRAVDAINDDSQLAAVGGKRIGVSSSPVGRAIALALSSRFGVGNSINHYADSAQLSDHASFGVYRADVARRVGGWDEYLTANEDVDFDYRIQQLGFLIKYDPLMEIHWQVRDRVVDLFKQYRRYGRGKASMIKKNGVAAIRLRHLAAPLAVLGGVTTVVTSVRSRRSLAPFGAYVAAVGIASVAAWRRRPQGEPVSVASLPLALMVMHLGWGLGFLEGVALGRSPALSSGDSSTID